MVGCAECRQVFEHVGDRDERVRTEEVMLDLDSSLGNNGRQKDRENRVG